MLKLTSDMVIGHQVIDDDHKELIRIINQFIITSKICLLVDGEFEGQHAATMHMALTQLIAYGKQHFAREEKIQNECMYAYREMHVAEHRAMMRHLEEMARSYFVTKRKVIDRKSLDELNAFLKQWLFDHILKFDTNMRDWVRQED